MWSFLNFVSLNGPDPIKGALFANVFRAQHFFFQAEDGIRDVAVTGVQTCALPIFALIGDPASLPAGEFRWAFERSSNLQRQNRPRRTDLHVLNSCSFQGEPRIMAHAPKIGRASGRGRG